MMGLRGNDKLSQFINKDLMKLYNYKISKKDNDWNKLLATIFNNKKMIKKKKY